MKWNDADQQSLFLLTFVSKWYICIHGNLNGSIKYEEIWKLREGGIFVLMSLLCINKCGRHYESVFYQLTDNVRSDDR